MLHNTKPAKRKKDIFLTSTPFANGNLSFAQCIIKITKEIKSNLLIAFNLLFSLILSTFFIIRSNKLYPFFKSWIIQLFYVCRKYKKKFEYQKSIQFFWNDMKIILRKSSTRGLKCLINKGFMPPQYKRPCQSSKLWQG